MSEPLAAAPKTHADLGASSAYRWIACPGSVRLARSVPTPPSTDAAEEGTLAHALAELCLNRGVAPSFYVGQAIEGEVIEDEMAEHVAVFTGIARDLMTICSHHWIERKFNLAPLNPPAPMYGTADFVAYDAFSRTLHVVDLKYGAGVVVEVTGNPQLRYYALGAALSLDPKLYPIEHVHVVIVQPRVSHADGQVRIEMLEIHELHDFSIELMEAAAATQAPDAPLHAGDHCRFCPAAGVCPEQRRYALAIAQSDFDVVPSYTPPAPATIPMADLAAMAAKFSILEAWMAACRAHITTELTHGREVPGFKLVAKRAVRKWTDDAVAAAVIEAEGVAPILDEVFVPRELKSPAQVEKIVGKKAFRKVEHVVQKKSSGYRLAPAHDRAPAIQITPGDEFDLLLPAGEE